MWPRKSRICNPTLPLVAKSNQRHVELVPIAVLGKGFGKFCNKAVVRGMSSLNIRKLTVLSAVTVSDPSVVMTRHRYGVFTLRSLGGVKDVVVTLLSVASTI